MRKKILITLIALNGAATVVNIAMCDLKMALACIVAIGFCVWAYDDKTKGGNNANK